jgi:hypothetical protein
MSSNNGEIEKAAVTLKAVEFDSRFEKVRFGDAFVYGFSKTLPQRLVNWSSLDFFDGFMLNFQMVAYEC